MPSFLRAIVFLLIAGHAFASQGAGSDDEFKSARIDQKAHAVQQIQAATGTSRTLQQQAATVAEKKDPAAEAKLQDIQTQLAQKAAEVDALANQYADPGVLTAAAQFSLQTNDNAKGLARSNDAVNLALSNNEPQQVLADALRTRAMAYAATSDNAKANADAKRVLKMFPDDELADRIEKLTRGRPPMTVNLPKNTPPPAPIQALLDAVRRSPVNRPQGFDATVAHTKEAESGLQMGDYQKMYDEASKAIEKFPGNPKAYMQRAFAALMLKNYEQVIKDAEAGLKLKPGAASLLGLRAAAYNETGRPQKALDDAARAIEDNPKDPFAWLQKGLAREKINEGNDEYLGDIKNAAELNPEFEHYYTEALARRGQGQAAAAPSAPPQGGLFQRWILPVATVGLCLLVMLAAFFNRFSKKKPLPKAGGIESPEGKLLAGQYRIVRELGRGGMGVVYEAWDKTLERSVALKRIMEDLKGSPDEAGRLLREAQTVASLRHDNIVVIHNAFEDAGDVYCVFELMPGETLQDFLDKRLRLEPVESTTYIAPICAALDYAHGLKVIHRDLKPANVMLDGGKVKIMDFGIARRMKGGKGVTMTELITGTPAYMAPELNFGEVSPESDLYALGVMVYQMLTGRLPFEGHGLQQDKFDARYAPASTYVKNAPAIDAFFKKALSPDRKERFHSGAEFLAAYRQALV